MNSATFHQDLEESKTPPASSHSVSTHNEHETNTSIVTWDGPNDPQDPFNWPLSKKWRAVIIGLLVCLVSTMNGTIISVAHNAINDEYHISDATFPNSYWPTTAWGVGSALFPLILFPMMEDFGVRPVVLGSYFVFICFLIPAGLAQNFATLIVIRFFSGGCVQLVGNAVVGITFNVFPEEKDRNVPVCLYITTYLTATSLGSVVGAAILQNLDWRWIGYIELIWTAAFFPVLIVALPESCGPVILRAKAKRLRREGKQANTEDELHHKSLLQVASKSIRRPLYMLCTEPVVFVATLWCAFSFGTIYTFTQSIEQVYGPTFNWNSVQAGYIQAAIVIGELLGCCFCLYTIRWYYDSASRNTEDPGTPIPEARLYPSIIGGTLGVACGMFVYGWTSYPELPWMAPTVGLAMVGFGTMAVVVSIVTYFLDAYSKYASSALGAVGLLENLSIAFMPLASASMYDNLGFHWASSLLGFLSLVLVAAPFAVFRWGKEIRARSPFMKEAILERRGIEDTADSA